MRVVRKLVLVYFLCNLTLFVQTASATLAPMRPQSTYDEGAWYGFEPYNIELEEGSFLRGRVDFAIYDTETYSPAEQSWVEGLGLSGQGRFLYAYQIFNDYPESDEEVAYFSVFAESGNPLDVEEDSIDSSQDPENGVELAEGYLADSDLEVVWTWEPEPDGHGFIFKTEHSWFLLFFSNSGPVPGDFEVRASEGAGELPTPVPEPTTIALLGLGSALALISRRRSLCKSG